MSGRLQAQRSAQILAHVGKRRERQCREHLELLAFIEAGDLVTASAYLRVHIGTAGRIKTSGLA